MSIIISHQIHQKHLFLAACFSKIFFQSLGDQLHYYTCKICSVVQQVNSELFSQLLLMIEIF